MSTPINSRGEWPSADSEMPASHLRASIEARNAKKKAMENAGEQAIRYANIDVQCSPVSAVWLLKSTRKVRQASPATQLGSSGAGSNHRKQRKITNTDVAARSDKSLPLKTSESLIL